MWGGEGRDRVVGWQDEEEVDGHLSAGREKRSYKTDRRRRRVFFVDEGEAY